MSTAEIARRLTELTSAVGRVADTVEGVKEKVNQTAVWQAQHIGKHGLVDAKVNELVEDVRELKEDKVAAAKERVAAARFRWTVGVTLLGAIIAAIIGLIGSAHG